MWKTFIVDVTIQNKWEHNHFYIYQTHVAIGKGFYLVKFQYKICGDKFNDVDSCLYMFKLYLLCKYKFYIYDINCICLIYVCIKVLRLIYTLACVLYECIYMKYFTNCIIICMDIYFCLHISLTIYLHNTLWLCICIIKISYRKYIKF